MGTVPVYLVVFVMITNLRVVAITVSPVNPEKGDMVTLEAAISGTSISWIKDSDSLTSCIVSIDTCSFPTPSTLPNALISVTSSTSTSKIVMTSVNQTLNGGIYEVTGSSPVTIVINSLPTTIEWVNQPDNGTTVTVGIWKVKIPCVYPKSLINVEFEVYINGIKQIMNSSNEETESNPDCESTEETIVVTFSLSNSSFQNVEVYTVPKAWHTLFPGQVVTGAQSNAVIFAGQTQSTHLTPTTDVGRSSPLVTTDGGIVSLKPKSNLPDETMIISSIFSSNSMTSSLLIQTSASSDISPYYIISYPYTATYLISTLTTNIFGNSISWSSTVFLGHYSESSLISNFDTMTSNLSILSANSDSYSLFSTVDILESSIRSFSKIYSVDSITNMSLTSFVDSASMSSLKSLTSISLSDSLSRDLQSQIKTSPRGIVSTQIEKGSHIDRTPLTPFTYTHNLQLSLEISYQPSLSPTYASHLAKLSTQTLLTIPSTLPNLDTNSMLLTTFTPDETSTFYLSSKYITSVDYKSSFDFDSNTKNGTRGSSRSKIIETLTLNSIAESNETKSAKISMSHDLSSNMLINSPITSFGSTPGTLVVHPTMVEVNTSMDSFFETFEDKASTLNVNSLQTRLLSESKTVGIIMSSSVETSNENTDTLFESSTISPSTSFNHMHESSSLHTGIESDSVYKTTSSANSLLFDSFSILPEKDSDNVLSITPDVVVWSKVSRISLVSLSPIWSSSNDSTAYLSTKYMSSISVNSDKYSSATNAHLSQPKDFESTILPSVSNYFYFSDDINTASSSLLVSSSVNANPVLTYGPSLTKSSKVIAISVTVVGCILFVAITILVLFVLKLLQCKSRSKVSKTNKKFSKTDSNSLSISTGGRRGTSLFDKPYGLPTRYYDKTATSWGVNDNQFTCTYNKNWDDIT